MRVSELLARLGELSITYGDLDVHVWDDTYAGQSWDAIDAWLDEEGPKAVIVLTVDATAEFAASTRVKHRRDG